MISENATCAWSRPWTGSNFFLHLWIELTFCINLAMHMLFDGKLFLSKTNWSIQSIFNFSKNSAYIVHGRRPFKFARCAIILLFELNGNPSLRVTSGGRFASAKRICWFWCPSSLENAIFQQISWFSRTMVAPWWTLSGSKLFSSAYGANWNFA